MDLTRVMGNRSLRCKLWRFLVERLQARDCVPAVGCTLVLDHFKEGAYCFDAQGWWLDESPDNKFGEADLKLP